jgi:hypothetical protein
MNKAAKPAHFSAQTGNNSVGPKGAAPAVFRPRATPVLLRKMAGSVQSQKSQSPGKPIAPPVYRPQPTPKVLQTKPANRQQAGIKQSARNPAAPPVYRPQPVPRVLQTKAPAAPQSNPQTRRTPVAPVAYRPQPIPRVLQRKTAGSQPLTAGQTNRQPPKAPPVYRPVPKSTAQPKLGVIRQQQQRSAVPSTCCAQPAHKHLAPQQVGYTAARTTHLRGVQHGMNNSRSAHFYSQAAIQLYILKTPKELIAKMQELGMEKDAAESLGKEFPNWFQKKKNKRIRDYDFPSDKDFQSNIQEFITNVDAFTDEQGYALENLINTSNSKEIFIGYNGGNAAYADAMEKEGLKSKEKASGLKSDMQLSHGHYVSTSLPEAENYAHQRVLEGKDGVVYEVFIDLTQVQGFPLMMKGASVTEWWKKFKIQYDDEYDIIVATLSGEPDIIQYKITPKSYHILKFKVRQIIKNPKKAEKKLDMKQDSVSDNNNNNNSNSSIPLSGNNTKPDSLAFQ